MIVCAGWSECPIIVRQLLCLITNIFELCVELYLIVSIYDFSLKCYMRIWAICMHAHVSCGSSSGGVVLMHVCVCVCVLGVWLWALCESNSPAGVDPTTHFPSRLWSSAALQDATDNVHVCMQKTGRKLKFHQKKELKNYRKHIRKGTMSRPCSCLCEWHVLGYLFS